LSTFLAQNTRHFGGYWRAMEFANDRARESLPERAARARSPGERAPEKLRVGSAYNWAVYMPESPLVELVKLPHQLNEWQRYDAAQKAEDLASIEELDLFLTHQPILTNHLDLMEWVNAHFAVAGVLFDPTCHEDLGPIYVLA